MNSDECKTFIESIINKTPIIKSELLEHNVTSFGKSKWSRVEKAAIKKDDDHSWIQDYIYYNYSFSSNLQSEMAWADQKYIGKDFIGCVIRVFCHKDCDCAFTIITDKNCMVCWFIQID